jgi:tetratricopeptide (TPR) repeat protein
MLEEPVPTPQSKFSSIVSNKKIWLLLLITVIAIILIVLFIAPRILAEYYFNKGNADRDQSQWTEAITNYTKAIQLNPQDNEAIYNRGRAYIFLKMYPPAITDFTNFIQVEPQDFEAYIYLGLAYYRQGMYTQASLKTFNLIRAIRNMFLFTFIAESPI